MIYGYSRVSTKCQMKDGNSLEVQEKQLQENGAVEIFTDSFTGTKFNRPQLDLLLAKLESGDTLIVTKLDRVARSLSQGSELVNNLLSKNVKVNILNIGIMDNTPASKLIRNIFFSFAEFERDMIVERTQEGKAIAKLKEGFTEGRPKKYNKDQVDHAVKLLDHNSYKEVEKLTGISKSTLIRSKRKVMGFFDKFKTKTVPEKSEEQKKEIVSSFLVKMNLLNRVLVEVKHDFLLTTENFQNSVDKIQYCISDIEKYFDINSCDLKIHSKKYHSWSEYCSDFSAQIVNYNSFKGDSDLALLNTDLAMSHAGLKIVTADLIKSIHSNEVN